MDYLSQACWPLRADKPALASQISQAPRILPTFPPGHPKHFLRPLRNASLRTSEKACQKHYLPSLLIHCHVMSHVAGANPLYVSNSRVAGANPLYLSIVTCGSGQPTYPLSQHVTCGRVFLGRSKTLYSKWKWFYQNKDTPVSYTHLTLPTKA